MRYLLPLLLLGFCVGSVSRVDAQENSATIRGQIADSKGAVVVDAKVIAINDSQGIQRETRTNREGFFVIPLLPAGTYTVTAEMPGFATVRVVDVVLQVNIDAYVPLVLNPAPVAETVSVAAESNQVDATNATVKYSVTNEQVRGLPVMVSTTGRNPLTILPFLVPGVSPANNYATASFTTNTRGGDMSINGARTTSTSYNFEGGDNNNYEENTAASTLPNPDALQEFTILTNNYQADQGRSVGGIVNAITKSGTKKVSGNLRYYLMNEALNARGFFDQKVPVNRLHTYGGQLGGPVVIPWLYDGKNQTFFFFDYEATRSRVGTTFNFTVPSVNERNGNFSSLPAAQWPRDPITRLPFTGGIVPQTRFNPITRLYLERFVPLPNNGTKGFITEFITDRRNNQYTGRFDHKLTPDDHLSATFFSASSDSEAGTFILLPVDSKRIGRNRTLNFVLSETHTFSARTVNQITGAITRAINRATTMSPGATGVDPHEFGFTGIRPQTTRFLGIPGISALQAGIRIDPTSGSFEDYSTTWQLKDDLSHARGNHGLRFGGGTLGFILNKYTGNNNGSFSFTSSPTRGTNNAIADILLGLPSSYNQTTGNSIFPRQRSYFGYVMDDWRARSSLTVNLGLRYELAIPMKDELDQVSVFRAGQKSQRFPSAPTGLLFAGDSDPILGTVPRTGYPTDKNNFAPRIGIAYSPQPGPGWLLKLFGDRKTAIRAGWGVFYDQTLGRTFTEVRSTQPFSVTRSLTAAQMTAAGGTFANPFGTLTNPFPLDLSARTFTGTPQVQPFDPDFRTAYTYQYNFTIQRELPWSLLMELAYVGSNSFKQNRERELNFATVGATATPDNFQERRLFPLLGDILSQESTGRANYNAAQLRLSRRFKQGLAFDGSYVFSKALDNASTTARGFEADVFRWARGNFDRTHNFVLSYTYEIPFGKGRRLRNLLGGWQVGGITEFRSGLPLDIIQIDDPTLSGIFSSGSPDFVGPFVTFNPRQVRTIVVDGVPVTANFFFDPNAFRRVEVTSSANAREGNLGRNVFSGPRLSLWSLSLIKRIHIVESHELELRADIRNLFNHALFAQPTPEFDATPPLGVISSSGPGRNVQVSLRYSF
jgi:hypothetical protein